jgi:anti-anti-sigma factor
MDDVTGGQIPPMTFEIVGGDSAAPVVKIAGELDISTIDELATAVAPIVARRVDSLTLDLSELRFADSSAIALWVRWAASVRDLRLINVSPLLRRVVETMGLTETLGLET